MYKENTRRTSCISVGSVGRALMAAALIVGWVGPFSLAGAASYGKSTEAASQGAPASEVGAPNGPAENQPPSNAEITKPSGSTEALMDAYNRRLQSVMDQADPFTYVTPEEAFSASRALKNNSEYRKALELYLQLVGEGEKPAGGTPDAGDPGLTGQDDETPKGALETYDALYDALLEQAKAHENLGQVPDVRELIEEAMASMAEDGTGVDAAATELYKEIMEKVAGQAGTQPPETDAP
ncbi:hypothetical protein [Desulfoluna spongiiphila]|uniref:hypothetical protein n=1 Tax=Desulfoluna spongiiphila TaxID=419481 RepID=UPI0012547A5E|nr:hypothetical protein [Desulfoluna spongiiphila]VVS94769.1 consensus disorder prediction [Desulfoluna spongiiphila]